MGANAAALITRVATGRNDPGLVPMVDHRHVAEAFAPDALRLIILPTEHCNFRCVYCYEDFSIGQMTSEVINGLKALLSRRASSLSRLRVSWFGGEPTAAINIVYDVMAHAGELAREHKLQLHGDMTTNAFRLNREMLGHLCELSVTHFQITLDGPETLHNSVRILANGDGTFGRIWKNLLEAKSSEFSFKITLRVHLTPANCEHMPMFADELRDAFLDDPRFSVFFKAVGHWGGPHDNEFTVLSSAKEKSIILSLTQRLYGDTANMSSDYNDDDVCYAAKANSFVIRADGRVEKCTVALNNPVNLVGKLNGDGSLTFNNQVHQNWLQGWKSMNGNVLGCPLWAATKLYESQHERSGRLDHADLADSVSAN